MVGESSGERGAQKQVHDQLGVSRKAVQILYAVVEHGGTATSAEVRDWLQADDTTTNLNYHAETHLEAEGWLEVENQAVKSGQIPPKIYRLTSEGEQVLETVDEAAGVNRNIGERLSQLEDQVENLRSRYQELSLSAEQAGSAGEAGGADGERLSEIEDEIAQLEAALNDISQDPVLADEDVRKRLTGMMAMVGVFKELAVEELGEDEWNRRLQEKVKKMPTLD